MAAIEEEIIERLSKLDEEKQKRVLEFVRSLSKPEGIPGEALVTLARELNFGPDDLTEMARAIEEGCEQIDQWDKPIFPA